MCWLGVTDGQVVEDRCLRVFRNLRLFVPWNGPYEWFISFIIVHAYASYHYTFYQCQLKLNLIFASEIELMPIFRHLPRIKRVKIKKRPSKLRKKTQGKNRQRRLRHKERDPSKRTRLQNKITRHQNRITRRQNKRTRHPMPKVTRNSPKLLS